MHLQMCNLRMHMPKTKFHRRHQQQRHHQCRIRGNLRHSLRGTHNQPHRGTLPRLKPILGLPTLSTFPEPPSQEWGTSPLLRPSPVHTSTGTLPLLSARHPPCRTCTDSWVFHMEALHSFLAHQRLTIPSWDTTRFPTGTCTLHPSGQAYRACHRWYLPKHLLSSTREDHSDNLPPCPLPSTLWEE